MSSSKRRDPAQTWWEVIGHCPGQICLQCAVGHQPGLSHQKPPSSPQKSGHKSLYSVHGDINSLARTEVPPEETCCAIMKIHIQCPLQFQFMEAWLLTHCTAWRSEGIRANAVKTCHSENVTSCLRHWPRSPLSGRNIIQATYIILHFQVAAL